MLKKKMFKHLPTIISFVIFCNLSTPLNKLTVKWSRLIYSLIHMFNIHVFVLPFLFTELNSTDMMEIYSILICIVFSGVLSTILAER